ncbi:MAG TPA: response regulator transcription factor [Dehalococcoidia bacterium]|nr:response regulator transcription factor [Dehalococcoidia bacterium]
MSNGTKLKLGVVCDYPIIRESVGHVLSSTGRFEITGEALESPPEAAPSIQDVILCICEARPDLENLLRAVRERYPEPKFACLVLGEDDRAVVTALRAGATGIIDDIPSSPDDLVTRLERIAIGEFVLSAPLATRLARMHAQESAHQLPPSKADWLTQREQEVLGLLAQGSTNRDIAARLSVSEHTVRAHLRGIMQKLQVTNRVQAAALAWRNNLVPESPREDL